LVTTTKECRFYFSEISMGNSITSSGTDYAEIAESIYLNSIRTQLV